MLTSPARWVGFRISVAIVTEGPASQAVLKAICKKAGVSAKVLTAAGKPKLFNEFDKILRLVPGASKWIVVPDLHPESDCVDEAQRWRDAIRERFPKARLCLAIWETESWLLADPAAIKAALGVQIHSPDPESVAGEKPSRRIEIECKKALGYRSGAAFDKARDGVKIVEAIDLEKARKKSPSLDRFLTLVA